MRAAVLEKFNDPYVVKDIPRPPEPQAHELLVRVLAASYCHTDAVFCAGQLSQDLPRIGCHEFAGEIVSLGPAVSSPALKVGTKVGIPGRAFQPCGTCFECSNPAGDSEGYSPYCPNAKNLGLTADGGFQEYCLVDSRQIAPIPIGLTPVTTAPLMCAGLTIWAALKRPEVADAKTVAIMGAGGGLGHLGVQFAAKLGMTVVAVDVGEKALSFVNKIADGLGSDKERVIMVDGKVENASTTLGRLHPDATGPITAGEYGVDALIVLPESQAAMDHGMSLLKNHGTAVVVSFPQQGFNISARDLVFRDIRVVGSLVGRNYQLREMLDFAAEHGVAARTQSFRLQDINELVKEYHKMNGGKLVVDMTLNE